jgi:hypothetical protein
MRVLVLSWGRVFMAGAGSVLLPVLLAACRPAEPVPDPPQAAQTEEAAPPQETPASPKTLMHEQMTYKPRPDMTMSWDVTVTDTGIRWTGYNSASLDYSAIESVELTETRSYWGHVYCLNLPPRITNCLNTIQISRGGGYELSKLFAVAEETRRNLKFWKKKHSNAS